MIGTQTGNFEYNLWVSSMTGSALAETESPFDENGRQWAWDTITLTWLEDCARKYKLFMLDGWRPKDESVHLRFGIIYSKALENYHMARAHNFEHDWALDVALVYALRTSWPWPFEDSLKSRENLIRSIIWYLDKFEDDPCKTVILDNGRPAVELPVRIELDPDNILVVHLDRIVEFADRVYVQDQKTTWNSVGSFYFDRFSPDVQMSDYTFVGKIAFRQSLEGVMLDVAQIQVGGTQFKRGFTYRTGPQLEEWIAHTKFWIGPYRDAAEAAGWPMNPTSCGKFGDHYGNKSGGCPLRKVCSADPRMRDKLLESDFKRKPWNPLAERT